MVHQKSTEMMSEKTLMALYLRTRNGLVERARDYTEHKFTKQSPKGDLQARISCKPYPTAS